MAEEALQPSLYRSGGAYGIAYIRTLRLLSEMVETQHKTVKEVVAMACALIEERGKRIAPKVLNDWKASLR